MENIVHAHELLNLIMGAKNPYTVEELKKIANEKFNKDVKFTNCSGNLYSLNEVLEFFVAKEKIIIKDNMISVNKEKICNH
jgi:probable metal-binding protein|tara:strand:- start:1691 stop:1933 length:243 start_codon:yes stop_codon:yes gene_type:complete